MLGFGQTPSKPGRAVDLRKLDDLIDYPARDMTITVRAGITMARLQALLAAENQRLPVDVPLPQRATLGGAAATNCSGPRRYGFGTFRDYVIGISLVNDQGQEVKAGGRVVKNVAGYDLCKLYIGSLGTLGIITQLTLKLRPLPERSTLIELPCPPAQLEAVLELLHQSQTRPAAISVLSPGGLEQIALAERDRTPDQDDWLILAGFEENAAAVDWQVEQLHREVQEVLPTRSWHLVQDSAAQPLWQALTDFPLSGQGSLTFKANVLPQASAAFCRQAAALPEVASVLAHAGNGIIFGQGIADLTLERGQAMLKRLQEAAAAAQGNVVLLRCPAPWKRSLSIWGTPRNDLELMRTVKAKLDPQGLFNPGRFVV